MQPIQQTQTPPLLTSHFSVEPAASWKEAVLISAIALSALGCFVQIFMGSFSLALVYGFLGAASSIGYQTQKESLYSQRKEEYYSALHKSTETLRQDCQVLKDRLHQMESLLSKIDASATLTEQLLTSCIDVSQEQKKNQTLTQQGIEKNIQHLEQTIRFMEQQIRQFFLHDARASQLLEVKQEFLHISKDLETVKKELERVQKELSETSARLGSQISQLSYLQKLTPLVLGLLKKPELHQKLSFEEKEQFEILQRNWHSLSAFA